MPETTDALKRRDDLVEGLRRSLTTTEHGLGALPDFLKVVIRDEMWRERVVRQTGEHVVFSSFSAFVTAPPLDGLGATLAQLRGLCRDDREALDALDRATARTPGRPHETTNNVSSKRETEQGNSTAQALRRLRKDRPDLHARVLAGELSPHAAAIEAGWRRRTVQVEPTVDGAVKLLVRLSREQREDVARSMGWTP